MATAISRPTAPLAVRRHGVVLTGAILTFLTFFTIAFPKGGIKIYEIPITFGYLFTAAMLLWAMLRADGLSIPLDRLLAFAPCLLLGLWSALVVAINGSESFGYTLSYFTSVLYLPLFGLAFFAPAILDDHGHRIERAIVWAVRLIVVYGIFLFLFKQFTGSWIEVPYLTVNVADAGQLDDKFINRGGVFKLISTYNNGNIFGVSLAILAPLYLRLENRKILHWAVYAAMFLTLSRTAWIAAIMIMALRSLSKGVRPITLLYLAGGILLAGAAVVGLLSFLGRDLGFIFDSDLGGRADQLRVLNDISLIPDEPVSALPEIVYLGVLEFFGLLGLALFVAHLLVPSLILMAEGVRIFSLSRASACLHGLLIYLVIAGADAAYSYIPVMMIFWMVAGMGFWYARRQAVLVKGPREAAR